MKKYVLKWQSWTGGNYISYFINSHKNFPQPKDYKRKMMDGQHHVRLDANYFNYISKSGNTCDLPIPSKLINNNSHTKILYTAIPHGKDDDYDISLDDTSVSRIILNYSSNIHSELFDRLVKGTDNEYELEDVQYFAKLMYNESSKSDRIMIDANEIFQYNEDEYLKLCEFIEEEPMPNWREYIDTYWRDVLGTTFDQCYIRSISSSRYC